MLQSLIIFNLLAFFFFFFTGPADPQNTSLLHQTNTVVKRICEPHSVYIDMRDKYNNKCLPSEIDLLDFSAEIKEVRN